MKEKYSNILVEFFEKMSSWESSVVSDRKISLPQMHLLEVVGNHKKIRMKELADKLGVTTGTLTVMVYRLENKGYLVREKDKEDKRSYLLKLTQKGNEEYIHHHYLHGNLIEEITDMLGESNSKDFFMNLIKIQKLM